MVLSIFGRESRPTHGFNPYGLAPARPRRNFGSVFVGFFMCLVMAAFILLAGTTQVSAAAGVIKPRNHVGPPAGAVGLCKRYNWVCATTLQGAVAYDDSKLLTIARSVNRRVNRSVTEITDEAQYRQIENWSLPTRRGGDCEDFALLKKYELMKQGVAPQHLVIATALTEKREPHAVLILRTGSGDYVLDNRRHAIMPWNETGYSFLRMQDPDAPKRWLTILAGGMF